MGKGPGEQGKKKKEKKGEGTAEHKQEGSSLLSMRMQFEPRILVQGGELVGFYEGESEAED